MMRANDDATELGIRILTAGPDGVTDVEVIAVPSWNLRHGTKDNSRHQGLRKAFDARDGDTVELDREMSPIIAAGHLGSRVAGEFERLGLALQNLPIILEPLPGRVRGVPFGDVGEHRALVIFVFKELKHSA